MFTAASSYRAKQALTELQKKWVLFICGMMRALQTCGQRRLKNFSYEPGKGRFKTHFLRGANKRIHERR